MNNYRAIAISNAITKLLKEVLMKHLDSVNEADDYQFGFKKRFFNWYMYICFQTDCSVISTER